MACLPSSRTIRGSRWWEGGELAAASVFFAGFEGNISEVTAGRSTRSRSSNMEFLVGTLPGPSLLSSKASLDGHTARPEIHALAGGDEQRRPQLADHQVHLHRSRKQHAHSANHFRGLQRKDRWRLQSLSALEAVSEQRRGEQQRNDRALGRRCVPGRQQRRRLRILRLARVAPVDRPKRHRHGLQRLRWRERRLAGPQCEQSQPLYDEVGLQFRGERQCRADGLARHRWELSDRNCL